MDPYITDAELKSSVAAALGVTPSSALADEWDEIISNANQSAADDIAQALLALGFLQSTIEEWDQGEQFNRDLGTFWALTRGAGLGGYGAPQLKTLDRREELRTMTILTVDGVAVAPEVGASAAGGIGFSGRSAKARSAAYQFRVLSGEGPGSRWPSWVYD